MSFIKLAQNIKNAKINEALIINEIMKNSKDILKNKITLSQISKLCNISHSSVSRLLTKIGWATWGEFIQSCILEEAMAKEAKKGLLKVLDLQRMRTNQFIRENPLVFKQILKLISKQKMIIFFGERVAGNIAQYFSFLFARKNIMTTHFFFEQEMFPFLRNETTVFILSTDGRTNYHKTFLYAKAKGANVIVLDSSENPTIKSDAVDLYVKLPLVTYFGDEHSMSLMRSESIRHLAIEIFDKV